ncbi:MAG: HAD-IIIC family phosphatase [Oligoflexia bacterium]|nr:HAD-IIIC family phosphatase [Oligoflexia bacterium]
MNFSSLKKNLKKDFSSHKKISIALLGDSSTQLLHTALRGLGYEYEVNLEIFEADYDQVDTLVLNRSSELYQKVFDFIIIFQSTPKIKKNYYKLPEDKQRIDFATNHLNKVCAYYESIKCYNSSSKIIYFNFQELDDNLFGHFANKTNISFRYQVRKINLGLMDLGQKCSDLFILDLASLLSSYGQSFITDPKIFATTELLFSLDFLPIVSKHLLDIIFSIIGRFNKCLILDLDNTLWGGVIGDDGIENIQIGQLGIGKIFTEIQMWTKELKQRGVILAVCSKNEENIAKAPFENHPEMILRLEDIALFVANWHNKAQNIQFIQSTLNIGLDSMVFIDDNPVEREMVKIHLPAVTVPDLPVDPAEYLPYLSSLNLFETASYSENDSIRTQQYKEEANRVIFEKTFINEDDFLRNLEMSSDVGTFSTYNIPRIAQLTQRSNQFNLRTIRYTEDEIKQIASSKIHHTLSFTLKDKFGDHGLISSIILKEVEEKKQAKALFIDTWVMSCRVLKRGMEQFILNQIVTLAKQNGYSTILGEYLPTKKNALVQDLYKNLGMIQYGSHWILNISDYQEKTTFIFKN